MKTAQEENNDYLKQVNSSYPFKYLLSIAIALCAAVLIVDKGNYPSKAIELLNLTWTSPVTILIIGTVLVLVILHIGSLYMIFDAAINILDGLAFTAAMSCVIYAAFVNFFHLFPPDELYDKTISLEIILAICVIIIAGKAIHYRVAKRKIPESTVLDLKFMLYDPSFKRKEGCPILLDERAVYEDLLRREVLIGRLSSAIASCIPQMSYVIGVEGAWGSGKTTLINIVKKQLQDIRKEGCKHKRTTHKNKKFTIIDKFDPWMYTDPQSLLRAMLEAISQQAGLSHSFFLKRNMIKEISQTLAGAYPAVGIAGAFLPSGEKTPDEIEKIKNRISSYLELNNKIVVFFIENIDRAEADNVIFLSKMIGTLLSLRRVKLIEYKSMKIGFAIAGMGFIAGLASLLLRFSAPVMLNIIFLSFNIGAIIEGILQLHFYRKGVRIG